MSSPNPNFQFFLNVKRTVLVVSFVGRLNETEQHLLNDCVSEIFAQAGVRFVVFNLQGLQGVDQAGVRAFAIVQSALREKYTFLLCGLAGETKKHLETSGVIRESELHKDLLTALQVIIKMEG